MKRECELILGWMAASLTWILSHYNAIIGALIGTVALAVWLLKLRREWKHRNDTPED